MKEESPLWKIQIQFHSAMKHAEYAADVVLE